MKKTKIVCSIGPASSDPSVMSEMVRVGMNVARINFSHATLEERANVVSSVKQVREMTGANVAILYDTKGPEFRSGMLEKGEINLVEGNFIRVVKEEVLGTEERFSVNHPQAIAALKVGDVILLENGLMMIEVTETDEEGATCKIINGGILGNKKSLSAPGIDLNIPFISEQDKEDIIYAANHDGDYIALSFVNRKEDVLEARKLCDDNGNKNIKLISKIESLKGIENLDEIIAVSDGVMVARGDLGVEVPLETLPTYQKLMIEKCREAGKICIVATEMLESMKKSPRPTRAEVSDIAAAVITGADAVMLSGETTVGKYPIDTVRHMGNICLAMEQTLNYSIDISNVSAGFDGAIANSVAEAANLLDAKVIIANTMSGNTARMISNLRPKSIIAATCQDDETARSLALNFGVYPVIADRHESTDDMIKESKEKVASSFDLEKEDIVVISGSFPYGGKTNFMKIEQI